MNYPVELYRVEQIRKLEQLACDRIGELTLMRRAGAAAFCCLQQEFPDVRHITVLCGGGNNGGDGYVVANMAFKAGLDVRVLIFESPDTYSEATYTLYQDLVAMDVEIQPYNESTELTDTDLIVDAMFGIGLNRAVEGLYLRAIELVNEGEVPVLALDVPSGLDANTGCPLGNAIVADTTVTFIGNKQGLVSGQGKHHCGRLVVDTLSLAMTPAEQPISGRWVDGRVLDELFPAPPEHAHKGILGHVLVVGGDIGMPGAVCLAAEAAMRVGTGKVTVVTHAVHTPIVITRCPELLICAVEENLEPLERLLRSCDVCLFGPGLTDSVWSRALIKTCFQAPIAKVVDAGALNFLSQYSTTLENTILTPHSGEAACLLGKTVAEVEANRYQAALEIANRYTATTVLKGAGTIIQSSNDVPHVCRLGNPGMATAGMGDVLGGMIAGLVAMGCLCEEAAIAGVVVHAYAGDLAAAKHGQSSLLASDVYKFIGHALQQCGTDLNGS